MARVSRKNLQKTEAKSPKSRVWNTAIYARVSNFNAGRDDQETLDVQVEYLRQETEQRAYLNILDVYADNGYSGTNFQRPEFERLLTDIQEKKIDCVVVKDLSRFGRNFVETGYYLEKLFPFLGVRFISVNDQYDSEEEEHKNSMVVPIKDMLNEYYSRDLSKKVRTAFDRKRKNGETCAVIPFGYQKMCNGSGKLILDEEVSPFVKIIFEQKRAGKTNSQITKYLNEQNVPFPYERRKQLGITKTKGKVKRKKWITDDVKRILKNPLYTGSMVYNIQTYVNGFNKPPVKNPREQWKIVEDAHPAIISWELFDTVYEIMQMETAKAVVVRNRNREEREQYPNIFQDILYCHKCGEPLRIRKGTSSENIRLNTLGCIISGHSFTLAEPLLRIIIMDDIRLQISLCEELEQIRNNSGVLSAKAQKMQQLGEQIDEAQEKLLKVKNRKRQFYEELTEGIINEEDYFALRNNLQEKEQKLKQKIEEIETEKEEIEACFTERPPIKNQDLMFSRELMESMIKRIEIDENKQIYITYRFKNQAECLEKIKEITQ